MPDAATPGILCLLPGEGVRIPCDAVYVIECGHDSDEGIPGAVVLSCTLDPGHDGDLHHDIDGLWWRADA